MLLQSGKFALLLSCRPRGTVWPGNAVILLNESITHFAHKTRFCEQKPSAGVFLVACQRVWWGWAFFTTEGTELHRVKREDWCGCWVECGWWVWWGWGVFFTTEGTELHRVKRGYWCGGGRATGSPVRTWDSIGAFVTRAVIVMRFVDLLRRRGAWWGGGLGGVGAFFTTEYTELHRVKRGGCGVVGEPPARPYAHGIHWSFRFSGSHCHEIRGLAEA